MMTEAEINYQFSKIKNKVILLNQAADHIQDVQDTLQELILKIDKAWDGVNSIDYIQLCKKECKKMSRTTNKIRETADKIYQIGEIAKKAEEASLLIAQAAGAFHKH